MLKNDRIRVGDSADIELYNPYYNLLWIERRGQEPAEPNLRVDKGCKPNQLIMVKGRQQTPFMA